MRVYLAARYSRRLEIADVRRALLERGVDVQSRWLDGLHDDAPNDLCARDDLADIDECHALVAFTEERRAEHSSGGRHFEAGYAHAQGKPVIVVGPEENVFYSRCYARFGNLSDLFLALDRATLPGICRECGCTDEAACPDGCAWTDETSTECTTHTLERAVPKRPALVITGDFEIEEVGS